MLLRRAGSLLCLICVLIASLVTYRRALADRLPTIAEKLRQHHIDLSKGSLISALLNTDPEVRYLAAEQLAEDKATDAVPELERALQSEQVPATKVNIAFSLALLHDNLGLETLKSVCTDSRFPGYLRLRAASYTLKLKNDGCVNTILHDLESSKDAQTRIGALSLATQLAQLSNNHLQTIYPFILAALDDATPAVRLSASDSLATIGNPAAIPYLEHAITIEEDQTIRAEMQDNLNRLKNQQKGQTRP